MTEKIRQLNKIEEKVKTHLRQNHLIFSGMHVCVCISGGMDSVVLLWMLYRMREELDIRLSACHFNHMIRGEEADQDEAFCCELCLRLSVPFYCGKANIPALHKNNNLSVEETAREARYAWFQKLAEEHRFDRLATAHHKNDQAETVLFRIIRGTTVSGLCGIPKARDCFIRPLLCLDKSEIEHYASGMSIDFRLDSTNFEEQYTRNYLRHSVLPMLKKINPSVINSVARLSAYATDDETFLQSMLPTYTAIQDVSNLPMPIIRRTVARNYLHFCGKKLCYPHIDQICSALSANKQTKIGLPNNMTAVINFGSFYFEQKEGLSTQTIDNGILTEGTQYCCGGRVKISLYRSDLSTPRQQDTNCDGSQEFVYNLSTEIPLSFTHICGMIEYRSRQQGDRLFLRGVNRSVKKMFSEQKIPRHLRESIPVFYDEQGIICIPFIAVSDRAYSSRKDAEYILRVDLIDEHSRKVVKKI